MTVGHVHDTRKDFLAWNHKPQHIREVYSCKLMMLGDKGSYVTKEFEGGGETDTKTELNTLATENKATVTVVGMHGRKGPKA